MQVDMLHAGPLPLAAALGVIGLLVTALGLWSVDVAWDARSWDSVTGRVAHSSVEADYRGDDAGVQYDVQYEYTVGGERYRADAVRASDQSFVRCNETGLAHETVARFPKGASVTVYYDPDDPRRAVLDRSAGPGWLFTLLGVGFMLGGVTLFAVISRQSPALPADG